MFENRNAIAVVTLNEGVTTLNAVDWPLYNLPSAGASSVGSLAYDAADDTLFFVNSKDQMTVFKVKLNSDGKTLTVLDSFDGASKWGVGRIGDIAFEPRVSPNLLVLTREDPITPGVEHAKKAQVLEVVVTDSVPGHTKGDVIGHVDLIYGNIPQPGGLTFDQDGKMYIVGSRTSAVNGEKDFTRLDPLIAVPNQVPIANAGPSVVSLTDANNDGKESVTVNAGTSHDVDGVILDYQWTVDGIVVSTGIHPDGKILTRDLSVGNHSIVLRVRDNAQAAANTTVSVTVKANSGVGNQAPQVNAGADLTVTFPSAGILNGIVTDDGLPVSPGSFTMAWSTVSGPGLATVVHPSNATTAVTFSTPGIYVLRLSANDGSLTSTDDVTVTVQAVPQGEGIEHYGYVSRYIKKDVDPNGNYANWEGITFNPITQHMFLVDSSKDVIVETTLDGNSLVRVIDVSSFRRNPDPTAAPKAITWMGGNKYGLVFENRNAMTVVTINDSITTLNADDWPLYGFPDTGASSVSSLAFSAADDTFYFVNSKDLLTVFKAKLNSDANTMTILDSFNGRDKWNVGRIGDIAFAPRITSNLLVLTREDPAAPGVDPTNKAKVMEVVFNDNVPGHQKGDVIGKVDLVYKDTPQPGGLTFDNQGRIYIVGSRTSAVAGENDFIRFDPTIPVPNNQVPVADAGPSLVKVSDSDENGSEIVTLDASKSRDLDGSIIGYTWTVDGVSVLVGDSLKIPNFTRTYTVGKHNVILSVTDDVRASAQTVVSIEVSSTPVPSGSTFTVTASAIVPAIVQVDKFGSAPVSVDASDSNSSSGNPITRYQWTEGTTTYFDGSNSTATLVVSGVGSHTLTLTVYSTDSVGVLLSASKTFNIILNSVSAELLAGHLFEESFSLSSFSFDPPSQNFAGITFNALTQTYFVTDNVSDTLFEIQSNGTLLRTIDISGLKRTGIATTDAEGIAWIQGQTFALALHDGKEIAVVTLPSGATSLTRSQATIYDVSSGPGKPKGLAYDARENVFYWVAKDTPKAVVKARISGGEWETIWTKQVDNLPVFNLADVAMFTSLSPYLFLISESSKTIMEVDMTGATAVLKSSMSISAFSIPQAGGMTFGLDGKMFIVGKHVKGVPEKDFSVFTPSPVIGNQPPWVFATVPADGYGNGTGLATIRVDASASFDPENDPITRYRWRLDNDAILSDNTNPVTTLTINSDGPHVITLDVYSLSDKGIPQSRRVTFNITIHLGELSPGTAPQPDNSMAVSLNYIHPGVGAQQVQFAFDLSSQGQAEIYIFDSLGRQVKKLVSDNEPPGSYFEAWDLTNEERVPVSSGVYFALIRTPGQTKREKVVVVR